MALLPIHQHPDLILRARCAPVERFDAELERLVDGMVATMHAAFGVSLAAPQVGVPLRVAVVDLTSGESDEEILVLVNPRIVSSEGLEVARERCLSIPGLQGPVERARRIEIEAFDEIGERWTLNADGRLARVIQHQIDHLDGILLFDRVVAAEHDQAPGPSEPEGGIAF
jgi:peptide deformylase